MSKYVIYIYTNKKTNYKEGSKSLDVNVTKDEPYDKLSKRFNRYTHTIQYSTGIYNYTDYYIEIYDPNAYIYKYLLKYNSPVVKVESVDIFFQSSDKNNTYPLVIGIKDYGGNTTYYTYKFLVGYTSGTLYHKAKNYVLPSYSFFKKDDLLTRLLEELGLYRTDRKDKLVIRADAKPSIGKPVKYPNTGVNPQKITLSKTSTLENYPYDEYEHTIDDSLNVKYFYLTFNENSLYMECGSALTKLTKVSVYFPKSRLTIPVLIVLSSGNISKLYLFSKFHNDLSKSNTSKNASLLPNFDEETLKSLFPKTHNREVSHPTDSVGVRGPSGSVGLSFPPGFSNDLQFSNLDENVRRQLQQIRDNEGLEFIGHIEEDFPTLTTQTFQDGHGTRGTTEDNSNHTENSRPGQDSERSGGRSQERGVDTPSHSARTSSQESTQSSGSDGGLTIGLSTAVPILSVGTGTGVLIWKFPYLIMPSVKALV